VSWFSSQRDPEQLQSPFDLALPVPEAGL